jgi:phage baseplate assembly protein W
MAIQLERINPLDLQPRKAVGVALPFSSDAVFRSTYTTRDALKSNLVNFFLTEKGERFLNPDFGAGLRALIFEQMTPDKIDEIEITIRTGLSMWFPEVVVAGLDINQSPDTNTVVVAMNYRIPYTNIQDQLVINFEQ